ncbi:hypothetical protein [Cereibacter changlensis]|uniref:hypothetical protein n=1 Tax=Cereibacter changlensis TaxID=402884 RepID=UPI00403434A3
MPRYEWRERFIDDRVCAVVAESYEEAEVKREAGFWASERTVDFHSTGETSEMFRIDETGED